MIPLAIGLVCFLAALRVRNVDVRGQGAVAWYGLVAALAALQIGLTSGRIDRYRITLSGVRWAVPGNDTTERTFEIGGARERAELWVGGAGEAPAASLLARGGEGAGLDVHLERDASAVVLLEKRGRFSSGWEVLGGVPVGPGDTLSVRARDATYRLVTRAARGGSPHPYTHRLEELGEVGRDPAGTAPLPRSRESTLKRWLGGSPSVFQRTYPLADVLSAMTGVDPASLPALSSFLYYDDGRLHVALLDSEVERSGGAVDRLRVGSTEDGPRRILVAGLAHRDVPEPDLELPERFGVRPLASFLLAFEGDRLDARFVSPEVHALTRSSLGELDLPGAAGVRSDYDVRLSAGLDWPARQAVVFDRVSSSFAVAAQAVLRLPEDPRAGTFEIATPSGLARAETGVPFTLGTGGRSLLLRVDGQGTSAGFWLALLVLVALPASVFWLRPMTGPVFALALAAAGFVALRFLLSLSAHVAFPFVQEGQQISAWLLVLLPWAIVLFGEVGRGPDDSEDGRTALAWGSWRTWLHPVLYAAAATGIAWMLFAGSPAKRLVLGALPPALVAGWAWSRLGWPGVRELRGRLAAWGGRERMLHGLSLGAGLVVARVLMDLAGFREQITLGGTRVGLSTVYTPLVAVLAAWILARRLDAIRSAPEGEYGKRVASAAVELGGFLFLALLGVGFLISDFGIALVQLPGLLALAAVLGVGLARSGRKPVLTTLAFALPLMALVVLQAAPSLLRTASAGDPGALEARMGTWNRNELLLLERGDPAALRLIGERRSEALAVMRETMRSYTRGNLAGKGFLEGRVSEEIAETSTREHAVSALLASQWGLGGALALLLLLLSLLPPVSALATPTPAPDEAPASTRRPLLWVGGSVAALVVAGRLLPAPWGALLVGPALLGAALVLWGPAVGLGRGPWRGAGRGRVPPGHDASALLAAALLFTTSFAGLYMLAANYGLAFFTGKNVYLLSLDSVGDALESLLLLGLAAAALSRCRPAAPVQVSTLEAEWWHAPEPGRGASTGGGDG